MTNKWYDFLKRLVQVILPASGALYFGLANIWGFPNAEGVVGSIAVITTFLGVALGISTKQYNASDRQYDGKMVITPNPDGPTLYSLEVDGDIDNLEKKAKITFKTVRE